jgi:hypothetical protein
MESGATLCRHEPVLWGPGDLTLTTVTTAGRSWSKPKRRARIAPDEAEILVCQGRAVLVLIPVEVEEALAMAAEWVAADAKAERTR